MGFNSGFKGLIITFLKPFSGEENRKEFLFCGYLYIERSTCA